MFIAVKVNQALNLGSKWSLTYITLVMDQMRVSF